MPPQATPSVYPCPKCARWCKNKSGLTQHLNARHPTLACPLGPSSSQTNERRETFDEDIAMHETGAFPSSPRMSSEPLPPNVETRFHGLGGKFYRNYHTLLNGNYYLVPNLLSI